MILRRDHVAGGVFIAAGALVFAMSGDLPFGTLASPGAGMMPKLVLGLMMAFGAIIVARAGESPPLADDRVERFPPRRDRGRGLAVAIALYTKIGFVLSVTLLLFVLFILSSAAVSWRALAVSIGVTVGSYLLFTTLLKIAAAAHAVLVLIPVEATIDSLMLGFSVAFRPDVLLLCVFSAAWSAPWSACCPASVRSPASASSCR